MSLRDVPILRDLGKRSALSEAVAHVEGTCKMKTNLYNWTRDTGDFITPTWADGLVRE